MLEDTKTTIGVVQGALGQRWFDVDITGQDAHAGPTPMELRKDALLAASRLVIEVNRIARDVSRTTRAARSATCGSSPTRATWCRARCSMTMDLRNAKDETLLAMVDDLRARVRAIAAEMPSRCSRCSEVRLLPAEPFDAALVESRARGRAARWACRSRDIVSGAAHDAVYINRVAPTAMIFVPCEGGLSHNEIENARPDDLAAGANVLINVIAARAGVD